MSVSQYRHVLSLKKKKTPTTTNRKACNLFNKEKLWLLREGSEYNVFGKSCINAKKKKKFGALPSNSISQYTACFPMSL